MSDTFFTRSGGDPMTEEQMRREVERLIKTGRMPTLEELSAAVLQARKKYANKIRRARRENREDTANRRKLFTLPFLTAHRWIEQRFHNLLCNPVHRVVSTA